MQLLCIVGQKWIATGKTVKIGSAGSGGPREVNSRRRYTHSFLSQRSQRDRAMVVGDNKSSGAFKK